MNINTISFLVSFEKIWFQQVEKIVPNFSVLQYLRMSWDPLKGFFGTIFQNIRQKSSEKKEKEEKKNLSSPNLTLWSYMERKK
jgi:hypothetical protein